MRVSCIWTSCTCLELLESPVLGAEQLLSAWESITIGPVDGWPSLIEAGQKESLNSQGFHFQLFAGSSVLNPQVFQGRREGLEYIDSQVNRRDLYLYNYREAIFPAGWGITYAPALTTICKPNKLTVSPQKLSELWLVIGLWGQDRPCLCLPREGIIETIGTSDLTPYCETKLSDFSGLTVQGEQCTTSALAVLAKI